MFYQSREGNLKKKLQKNSYYQKYIAESLIGFLTDMCPSMKNGELKMCKTWEHLKSSLLLTVSQLSTSQRESKSGGPQMTEIVKCEAELLDFCTLTENVK